MIAGSYSLVRWEKRVDAEVVELRQHEMNTKSVKETASSTDHQIELSLVFRNVDVLFYSHYYYSYCKNSIFSAGRP